VQWTATAAGWTNPRTAPRRDSGRARAGARWIRSASVRGRGKVCGLYDAHGPHKPVGVVLSQETEPKFRPILDNHRPLEQDANTLGRAWFRSASRPCVRRASYLAAALADQARLAGDPIVPHPRGWRLMSRLAVGCIPCRAPLGAFVKFPQNSWSRIAPDAGRVQKERESC
jgi:hypothetical protein